MLSPSTAIFLRRPIYFRGDGDKIGSEAGSHFTTPSADTGNVGRRQNQREESGSVTLQGENI